MLTTGTSTTPTVLRETLALVPSPPYQQCQWCFMGTVWPTLPSWLPAEGIAASPAEGMDRAWRQDSNTARTPTQPGSDRGKFCLLDLPNSSLKS